MHLLTEVNQLSSVTQVEECHNLVPSGFNPFEADLSELGLLDNLISSVCASKSSDNSQVWLRKEHKGCSVASCIPVAVKHNCCSVDVWH